MVASRWSQWQLLGPGEQRRGWASDRPLGVVLEFGALRQWLADEARGWGADLLLGATAQGCQPVAAGMCTRLRLPGGGRTEVISDWVVDATGQERGLIGDPAPGRDPLVEGLGVEWLIELPPERWQPWADRLSFCLGSDWVPQGYGWVFPMQPGQLKVGVCRLMDPASPQPALGPLLARLISRLGLGDHRVLDRHGGLIRSTIGRRESHRRGRLMALGDAVSTANLLGGEGIRHAMTSSQVLAPLLAEALRHPTRADHLMDLYPKRLRRALGWRWGLSGRLARRTWLGLRNSQADRRLDGLLRVLNAKTGQRISLPCCLITASSAMGCGRCLIYWAGAEASRGARIQSTPRAARPWMAPMPKMCPRLVVASREAWLMPPKKAELGSLAPTLGCWMVALPMPIAITLATIITRATFGDQESEAGAIARRGVIMDWGATPHLPGLPQRGEARLRLVHRPGALPAGAMALRRRLATAPLPLSALIARSMRSVIDPGSSGL